MGEKCDLAKPRDGLTGLSTEGELKFKLLIVNLLYLSAHS